jgi:hypothetical protein
MLAWSWMPHADTDQWAVSGAIAVVIGGAVTVWWTMRAPSQTNHTDGARDGGTQPSTPQPARPPVATSDGGKSTSFNNSTFNGPTQIGDGSQTNNFGRDAS